VIDKTNLTLAWIDQASKNNNNADKILVDRVIHALLLLEGLVNQKLDFIFKGGTALMLRFGSVKRLSIDIDIIILKRPENLNTIFNDLVKEQGFNRFELQVRIQNSKIDKEHFKFYYTPIYKTKEEEMYILLDILYEEINYKNIDNIPIQSSFVPEFGTPIDVLIPSFDDILGDKLTAFAPNTTGIPYIKKGEEKNMEIIKQLYDVGNLFDVVSDLNNLKSTFEKFAQTELSYREKTDLNVKDVLDDIYQTSLSISTRGVIGNGNFEQLLNGIKAIKQFIFSESYQIEKAIIHSAKAAYLSSIIKNNANKIEKFTSPDQVKDFDIKDQNINRLNRLKKSNPEAFFYWYKIYELETAGNNV
jgi:predicted nucleotidyltransferase component of viral defense system